MGFFDKIKKIGIFSNFISELDDDFYEELEESLVMADMGAETTMEAVEELKARCKAEKIKDVEGARGKMREILAEYLTLGNAQVDLSRQPAVVLFIGVNGVGKTTSIGKLAARWKGEGRRVMVCAGDTFRAAAADQLTIWAERAGVDIIKQHEGADPAAVVYDAMSAAKARRTDVVLVDTA
ncbi:MAG TPA: signal recognition particle-docking protein FtsY, partial [Clostridiales bacterium]|nr:signal recognition particle-docking protein FtsY [Clostridiales bacterium]